MRPAAGALSFARPEVEFAQRVGFATGVLDASLDTAVRDAVRGAGGDVGSSTVDMGSQVGATSSLGSAPTGGVVTGYTIVQELIAM